MVVCVLRTSHMALFCFEDQSDVVMGFKMKKSTASFGERRVSERASVSVHFLFFVLFF